MVLCNTNSMVRYADGLRIEGPISCTKEGPPLTKHLLDPNCGLIGTLRGFNQQEPTLTLARKRTIAEFFLCAARRLSLLGIGGLLLVAERVIASQERLCRVCPMQRCRAFPLDRSSLKRLFRKLKGKSST